MIRSASADEKETTVQIIGEEVTAWTSDLVVYRKLRKLGWEITDDKSQGAWFKAPRKALTFRRGVGKTIHRKKRELTPEQRKAIGERFRKGRSLSQDKANNNEFSNSAS